MTADGCEEGVGVVAVYRAQTVWDDWLTLGNEQWGCEEPDLEMMKSWAKLITLYTENHKFTSFSGQELMEEIKSLKTIDI